MRTNILPLAGFLVASGLFIACGGKDEPKTPVDSVGAPAGSATPSSTTTELSTDAGAGQKLEEKADKKKDPGRSPEELRAQIQTRREESRKCYDDAKKINPKLEGQVSVNFSVDVKGKVTEASLDSEQTTLTDEKVTSCLITFIKTFQFPESQRGMESKIRYPFVFTRGRDANAK